ncbi:MAG: phosphodiester glycosidase family protein [Spirochaetota bacterium]
MENFYPHDRGHSLFLAIITALFAVAAGCASFPSGSAAPGGTLGFGEPDSISWQPVARGIDLAEFFSEGPPLRVYCLRVDTRTPGVEIIVTPPERTTAAGEYPGRRTSTFLERFDLTAAVNGSPFDPVRLNEGKPTDIVGISVFRGAAVSPPEASYDCLVRYSSGDFAIISQTEFPSDIDLALGGFHRILEDGGPVGPAAAAGAKEAAPVRHPRTGVGVSRSGRILYMVVIDGRNPVSSIGATETELAEWLAYFGARDGINLDGGGSSTMVIADGEGKAQIINYPLGYGRLGMERVVGNHLGVAAAR